MKTKTPLFDLIDSLSSGEIVFVSLCVFTMLFLFSKAVKYMLETRTLVKQLKHEQEAVNQLKKMNNAQSN